MSKFLSRLLILVTMTLSLPLVQAAEGPNLDIHRLADNAYAIVGPLDNRTPENLGNNATFGLIVTPEGLILIDSGATYPGAQRLHETIRGISDKPIRIVINTGGQDHRWLGNGYFKQLGAHIIANQRAVADQQARGRDELMGLQNMVGLEGTGDTAPVYADETFDTDKTIELGGVTVELHHAGHAHTPGDSFVWLPQQRIVFSGDIVYLERMLGVGQQSQSRTWVKAFEAIAALQPQILVPGHGNPGDIAQATAQTYDYLVFLRTQVAAFMQDGGGIEEISKVDQGPFATLLNADTLMGRNAQRVYAELEWE